MRLPSEAEMAGAAEAVKRRSARGGAFSVAMQACQFLAGSVTTLVLANLLDPTIFGIFFMVTIATELTSSFRDQGIPQAIARSQTLTDGVRTALLVRHARFNLAVSAAIVVASPGLALFFDETRVIGLAAVLAAGLAIDGMTNVHLGMLRQQLRFSREALIDVGALVGSSIAAIIAAASGWGLWALAVQHTGRHLLHAAGVLLSCPWRPGGRPRASDNPAQLEAVREFGRPLSLSRLLLHLARNVDRIVVGRVAGSAALGLYQTAYGWSVMPVRQVASPLLHVVSTSLARVRDDGNQYRTWFSTTLLGLSALCLPVLAGAAVTAPALVELLLGSEWSETAPLLQILIPAAGASLVSVSLKWAYYAEGHTERLLGWSLRILPTTALAVGVGAIWGATGVAVAWSAVTVLSTIPEVWWCVRDSKLRVSSVWLPFGRCAVAALCATAISRLVLGSTPAGGGDVVVGFVIVGVVFIVVAVALPGGREAVVGLRQVLSLLREPSDGR